jgi:hypothetical protein
MKVFLSWSGDLSHKIACSFRDWLPNVLQYVQPYVSSEDIDKGARWSSDIAKELESSVFGLLMITKDNFQAPWVSFEAGALSKTLDKSKVAPFLFNIKRADVQGPLLQFQSTIFTKEDISKLIQSINKTATDDEKLDETRLKKVFEVWYPELKDQLEKLPKDETPKKGESKTSRINDTEKILEEILDISRNQYKLINSPESLLPPGYLRSILRIRETDSVSHRVFNIIDRMKFMFREMEEIISNVKTKKTLSFTKSEFEHFTEIMLRLRDGIDYINHRIIRDQRQLDLLSKE